MTQTQKRRYFSTYFCSSAKRYTTRPLAYYWPLWDFEGVSKSKGDTDFSVRSATNIEYTQTMPPPHTVKIAKHVLMKCKVSLSLSSLTLSLPKSPISEI
jgi:hypothetical protein